MKEKANDIIKSVKLNDEQNIKIEEVRNMFRSIIQWILENTSSSREQSLTLTKLEEASMWIIKGISRENE